MFHSKVVLLLCICTLYVHYYQRAKDSMRKSGKLAALFPPQVLTLIGMTFERMKNAHL